MANITVRNIPDRINKRLKKRAELSHRSLNNEIIACLEAQLFPTTIDVEEVLEKSEEIRNRLAFSIDLDEINSAKREGRA